MDLVKLNNKIESKWRVQSFSEYKPQAMCIPYIDARDVMNRLDEVCSPSKWECIYDSKNGTMYCGIGIQIEDKVVWKWDCGSESNIEKEKGAASDAFKRAAVKWGIGRHLYETDVFKVPSNVKKTKSPANYPYCINESGNRIYDLTTHINNKIKAGANKPFWWFDAITYLQREGSKFELIEKKYKEAGKWKQELLDASM